MSPISLADAKSRLGELVDRVEAGESIASRDTADLSHGSQRWRGADDGLISRCCKA